MSSLTFKDYFAGHASDYVQYRPQYPAALYEFIASLVPSHTAAWDCATGNGQVALGLLPHFEHVYATDASAEQIANAFAHDRIIYSVGLAEASGLPTHSVEAVTVGSALHWLDPEPFHAEVYRVVKPGGAIAAWCIERPTLPQASPSLQAALTRFYTTLEPSIPPEIAWVKTGYRTLPFPFQAVNPPSLTQQIRWNAHQLVGYFSTWSASRNFVQQYGEGAIAPHWQRILTA
ncbi:MAG: class I SAM-dependent methyltransferase [Kaiparowitsia implicata GSE-PSE-MK54-09C]|jgi:ubiquinone/menaquinone biosynthesis C-methylase UbiE|nr:class I SAM-dependent methyltransferase [Kaiparowitsia implicata GSE-PSE-MK54-09C]